VYVVLVLRHVARQSTNDKVTIYGLVIAGVCLAVLRFPNYLQSALRRMHYYLTGE